MLKLWRYIRSQVLGYLFRFGVVGVLALIVDVAVFNLLSLAVPNHVVFLGTPIGAKVVSTVIATAAAWFGNRYWTFREHRRADYLRELFEYSIVAAAGMLISVGTLWFSHYALGLQSLLADNISANFVGFALATAFRFLLYRYWVFAAHRSQGLSSTSDTIITSAASAIFEDETNASIDSSALSQRLSSDS